MPRIATDYSMFPVTRKIYKYEIKCRKRSEAENCDFNYLQNVLQNMRENSDKYTYVDRLSNKWYGIDKVEMIDDHWEIVLANCKFNYRPNLIDVNNREERVSPKSDSEGDKEKTHLIIKKNLLIYEQRRNGTGAFVFCKLLNQVWKEICNTIDNSIQHVVFEQLLDNDFMQILRNANRIKGLKVVAESILVGSEYLNFSDDNGVQDEYVIEIKAKKRCAFNKNAFIQKIERLLTEGTQINKVTVDLNDEENNPRIINTAEFAQQYVLAVNKNSNGEVDTGDMFCKMAELL